MKHPIRWILAVVATLALLAVVAAGGMWVRDLSAAATAGRAQLEGGARSLAALDATAAASQFEAASSTLTRAQSKLGPSWLGSIPLAGVQYGAARELVGIGLAGSSAGTELATALREAPAASDAASSTPRLITLLTTGGPRVDAALAALTRASGMAAQLDARGLVPQLAKPVAAVKSAFAVAAPLLERGRALLALEKYLFSAERRILVVSQDSAELKPTGGFVGSFGIVAVGPKGVKLEKYADVYTLPDPAVRVKPPAGARMSGDSFTFRDANWWIDFPTSARTMLRFWKAAGQPKVDGIVAIDVVAMKDLLETLGPIHVPSYSETFTSRNLLDRLLYYTLGPGSVGSKDRKGVLVALATEMEKRLFSADSAELGKTALALSKAADAKHVQMYLSDPIAQAAAVDLGWSGRIAAPAGTTDLLVISNAMVTGSKVNMAMKKTIDYQVALRPGGSADTTLVLRYANTGLYDIGGTGRRGPDRRFFRDYLRINRSPGTTFPRTATGPVGGGVITTEYGLPTLIRTFKRWRMRTHAEIVASRVATGAWRAGVAPVVPRSAAATALVGPPQTGPAHYRLFLVRQADIEDIPTAVTVTAPPGTRITSVSAWNASSGNVLKSTHDDRTARVSGPLSGDMVVDVGLTSQ